MALLRTGSQMTLKSDRPFTLTTTDSIFSSRHNKVELDYVRTRDTLYANISMDSIEQKITIDPVNSSEYIKDRVWMLGIPTSYHKNHRHRYDYPDKLWLNKFEDSIELSRVKLYRKGDISLNISLPYVNYFNYNFEGFQRNDEFGFLGLGASLQYHFNNSHSIDIGASYRLNYPIPILFPVFDSHDLISVSSLSTRYHYLHNRWDYSGGLTYDYVWFDQESDNGLNPPDQFANNIGLILSGKYRISGNRYLGIEYNPTFINVKSGGDNSLNHNISLTLEWRIRVIRNK
jgi:hypothetical protein